MPVARRRFHSIRTLKFPDPIQYANVMFASMFHVRRVWMSGAPCVYRSIFFLLSFDVIFRNLLPDMWIEYQFYSINRTNVVVATTTTTPNANENEFHIDCDLLLFKRWRQYSCHVCGQQDGLRFLRQISHTPHCHMYSSWYIGSAWVAEPKNYWFPLKRVLSFPISVVVVHANGKNDKTFNIHSSWLQSMRPNLHLHKGHKIKIDGTSAAVTLAKCDWEGHWDAIRWDHETLLFYFYGSTNKLVLLLPLCTNWNEWEGWWSLEFYIVRGRLFRKHKYLFA